MQSAIEKFALMQAGEQVILSLPELEYIEKIDSPDILYLSSLARPAPFSGYVAIIQNAPRPAHVRQLRQNVRNFLLVATPEELEKERQICIDKGDCWRLEFVKELINELPEPQPMSDEEGE